MKKDKLTFERVTDPNKSVPGEHQPLFGRLSNYEMVDMTNTRQRERDTERKDREETERERKRQTRDRGG